MEATGPHFWFWDKWLDIVEQHITASFFLTNGHTFMHYLPGLTDQQLGGIKIFARTRDNMTYNFFTDKWTTFEYYCSKLIWQSYLYGAGARIGQTAGYWVLPYDITSSPNLVQYHQSIP
jgi:hypothetical protein